MALRKSLSRSRPIDLHQSAAQVFPDGDRLVALGADGVALIWSIAAGEVVQQLDIHTIRGKRAVERWGLRSGPTDRQTGRPTDRPTETGGLTACRPNARPGRDPPGRGHEPEAPMFGW